MARPARPWFRLYVETVHDLKLRRQPTDVRWVWVAVLASARESPYPGYLLVSNRIPMTVSDLAEVAAVPSEVAAKAVDEFIETDMLERCDDGVLHVVNWDKRQFESDSRTSASSVDVSTTERLRNDDGTPTEPPPPETETENRENPSVTSADADDGFEDFWALYPRRDGKKLAKGKAQAVWRRMSWRKRDRAMVGVRHYASSGIRAKDAHRWLRDEAWEDWQTPAVPDERKPEPQKQVVY